MSYTIKGMPQLKARVNALHDTSRFLREFAPTGIRYIKTETPRKTGNLSRSNVILNVSDRAVTFGNVASYAVPVHEGSRPHDIVPVRRKALRFPATPGGARLTGTPRKGAAVVFAKRVHHPGNKPNRWMIRGLQQGLEAFGMARAIVKVWNDAA